MANDRHKITKERVEFLRDAIERCLDRRIKTPTDFTFLADTITTRLRKTVSATTLKRIWGYINDTGRYYLPGRYSLCVLSQLIGYRDFEDFLDDMMPGKLSSDTIESTGETIATCGLGSNVVVKVWWSVDHMIRMLHTNGSCFKVIETCNTDLQIGDIAEYTSLTQNAPLYISRLTRVGSEPRSYIAGSRTGVRFEIETPSYND